MRMKAEIYRDHGVTGVKINGKVYPFAATRSFRPEGRILKSFSDHGLKFFNIFPSGIMTALEKRTVPYSQFGPVWVGDHEYNWDNLRKQADEIFGSIGEDTYVSVNAHLDPPSWYVEKHPELRDHWEQMIQNLGSEDWRRDAADYLCALVDQLDEWYPERVYAIFLLCGGTTEWYSYHADTVLSDPTELQQKAFQKFMGDETVRIPSPETLHAGTDGVIRSRKNQQAALDYWHFTNETVMETALYFAKAAKEHTNRSKLVGIFSGHIYGQNLDWATRTSYNRQDMLYQSPDIDMIFAPASYTLRKLSSTSGIRVPVDSISLHGKLFVHEIDSSTHLVKKHKEAGAISHAVGRDEPFTCTDDTKAYLRRETGILLAKAQGYWWFDMFSGYYDDPELMAEIQRLHEIQEKLFELPAGTVSQVISMLDQPSDYYLTTNTYYPMPEHQTPVLNLMGAPWDQGMTFDFDHPDFDEDRYSLYFFPALFAPEKKTDERIQALRQKGKNMLFCHAPYYAMEDELSLTAMEKHTGIRFERQELSDNTVRLCIPGAEHVTFDFTNQTWPGDVWHHTGCRQISPVFSPMNLDVVLGRFEENGKPACGVKFREDGGFDAFCACAPAPLEFMDEMYRLAKIFRYTDRHAPVYVNRSFACVYDYEGGALTLKWPEERVLEDCFTGEKIRVNQAGVQLQMKPRECRLFYVRPGYQKD